MKPGDVAEKRYGIYNRHGQCTSRIWKRGVITRVCRDGSVWIRIHGRDHEESAHPTHVRVIGVLDQLAEL